MATPTFTKAGVRASVTKNLPKEIFAVDVKNHELIKQAYVTYLANGRQNLAVTKKRGEVSGGGKKPWRQKGTGRARFGSSRNPIWRGGGIAFGPTGSENYRLNMSSVSKRQAVKQALSLKNNSGSIFVIEAFDSKDGKTAEIVKLLSKIEAKGKVLVVVGELSPTLKRSTANIQSVIVVRFDRLNVFDVINADTIIFEEAALKGVHGHLTTTKAVKKEEA